MEVVEKGYVMPERVQGLVCFLIAAFPLLSIYASPIPGVSIGDITLLVVCLYLLLHTRGLLLRRRCSLAALLCVVLLLLITTVDLLVGQATVSSVLDSFIRVARMLFYAGCIACILTADINWSMVVRFVAALSVISTFVIFAQYVVYSSTGYIIPGYISSLPNFHSDNSFEDAVAFLETSKRYRPNGLFLEPSHHAEYSIIGLTACLFYFKSGWAKVFGVLVTFGMVISTSTLGMALSGILWFIWLVRNGSGSGRLLILSAVFLLVVVFGSTLMQVEQIQEAFYKIGRYFFGTTGGTLFSGARMETYNDALDLQGFSAAFGLGFGAMPEGEPYMTSGAYLLYGLGWTGFIGTLLSFAYLILAKGSGFSKVLCFIFFLQFFVCETLVSFWVVLYAALILATRVRDEASEGSSYVPELMSNRQ